MTVWSTMEKPKGNSITMRLAERTENVVWSWVKQSDGKAGLALQVINGEVPIPEIPISKHFEVKEKQYEDYKPMLTLICVNYEFFEIFEILCQDLINHSKAFKTTEQLLAGIKNRILVWYELFKKDFKGLTKKQVIGLAAELQFFKLWTTKFNENIGTWVGPNDSPQDFISKNGLTGVEIKSTSWALSNIQISSMLQLDFPGKLFIAVYPGRLVDSDEVGATNLDEIVESIQKDLDPSKASEFQSKLLLSGYVPKIFNSTYFELGEPIFYRVVDGFPRLIRANIDSSITDCKYAISLSDLDIYKIKLDEIGAQI